MDAKMQNALLKEYEICQKATQSLETSIWTTAGVMGVGSIAGLLKIAASKSLDLPVKAGAGLVVIFAIKIWWGMAKRWWTIQHTTFKRMKHIEEDLGMFQIRYINYRDYSLNQESWRRIIKGLSNEKLLELRSFDFTPEELSDLDKCFKEIEVNIDFDMLRRDFKYVLKRFNKCSGRSCFRRCLTPTKRYKAFKKQLSLSRKKGVQGYLRWFPWLIFSAWLEYILYSSGCNQGWTLLLLTVPIVIGLIGGNYTKTAG